MHRGKYKRTKEIKLKISKSLTGHKRTMESRQKQSESTKGKKQSKIHIKNRSISMIGKNTGKKRTEEQNKKRSLLSKEEKNPNWKGKKAGYTSIHIWLKTNHGKADKCENLDCIGKSKIYDYALLRNKEYDHKRENFIKLCRSCHKKYDLSNNFFININK